MKTLKKQHNRSITGDCINHKVTVQSDMQPNVKDIAIAVMYNPAGYGLWGEKVIKDRDDNWVVEWKSRTQCD